MFSLVYPCYVTCRRHSEPGLPMVRTARFALCTKYNMSDGRIRARILYCTYGMKSTLSFGPRGEFAHFIPDTIRARIMKLKARFHLGGWGMK